MANTREDRDGKKRNYDNVPRIIEKEGEERVEQSRRRVRRLPGL